MARVHFRKFCEYAEDAYSGNGEDSKKAIYSQLSNADLAEDAFHDFFKDKVKEYALASARVEGRTFRFSSRDKTINKGFQQGNGNARKAAAIHFYFLCHDEYAIYADALNKVINLPALMKGEFETAVFGFGHPSEPDELKGGHPIPPRPSAPFHWPLYVSEQDANSPDADMGIWLNPLNHFSIPLSHRQKEKEMLDAFVRDERPFLICALVAPSGAGKTRLVSEWMRKFVPEVSDTDWDAGFVTDRDPAPWKNWDISRNTLIVIDYTYAYDEVMKAIAERCRYHRGKQTKKVRLLVIDHIYPQALQSDFFWSRSFADQGHIDSRRSAILFEKSPIELRAEEAGSPFLHEVIAATASSQANRFTSDDPVIMAAEVALTTMGEARHSGNPDAVRHPLFAALLGQAIREGRTDYTHWTRRDLIKHYFDKPFRLPWLQENANLDDDTGLWIGACVAAATLLRGASFEALRAHLPKSIRIGRGLISKTSFIEQAANRLVSSSDKKKLKPLEPDILGENFLIQFFKAIDGNEDAFSSFVEMLTGSTKADRDEASILMA